jgi:hypothetical protein
MESCENSQLEDLEGQGIEPRFGFGHSSLRELNSMTMHVPSKVEFIIKVIQNDWIMSLLHITNDAVIDKPKHIYMMKSVKRPGKLCNVQKVNKQLVSPWVISSCEESLAITRVKVLIGPRFARGSYYFVVAMNMPLSTDHAGGME